MAKSTNIPHKGDPLIRRNDRTIEVSLPSAEEYIHRELCLLKSQGSTMKIVEYVERLMQSERVWRELSYLYKELLYLDRQKKGAQERIEHLTKLLQE